MSEQDALLGQIHEVARLRRYVEKLNNEYITGFQAFEAQYANIIADIVTNKAALRQAEIALREATIATFLATGNKHPAPGVGIRMTRQVSYSEDVAIAWAIKHGHTDLLKLNYKPFEQAAKVLALDFVTVAEVPEATIARDLEEEKK